MRRMAADYQRGRIRVTAAWALLIGVAASLLIQAAANAWLLAQRPMIEARLAEATGAPARIGEARIVWQGFRPLLALRDVRLLMSETGAAKLRVEGARLGAAPAGLLQGVLRLNRIELAGSELRLQEDESGWRLGGGGAGGGGFDPVALQRLAARFEAITVRDFEISARPLHSALPVSAHLDEASLRPESGGWRLRATLHDAERSGRLTATGVVSGDAAEPDSWRHNWRLAFDGSHDFAHSLGRLYPDAPMARIEGGRLRGELRSQGRGEGGSWMLSLDARAARIYGAGEDRIEDLHAVLSAHLVDERLDIAFQRLTLGGASQSEGLHLSYRPADGSGRLRARRLELGVVSPLLRAAGGERLPRLEGALRRLRLGWGGEAPALERIEASLEKVALEGESYRVAGLSGRVSGGGAAGRLQLEEGPLTLALDAHLFTPLRMDRAAGALAWRVAADGGRVLRFEELALSLDSLHARGGGSLRLPPQDAPELELDMALSAGDVEDAKPFMPRAWKPELRDYLAQAVEGARVPEGRLRLAAALTPDFMRQPEIELGIDLDVEDAAVRFHPEWPSAQGISGSVAIDASGLAVHAERAGMAGLQLRDVRVGIADFREAVLRAEASHRAALDDWYAMLRASPLAERLAGLTERTRGRGDAELDFALTLPLKNRPATKAEGSVTLDGAELEVAAIDASFRDIRGRVHFVNEAVAAEVLEARLHGRSVSARLDTRDGVPHLMAESRVDLGNPEGLARLLPGWLQPRLSGDVPLSMDLTLAPVDGFNRLVLSLDSRGLTVDLPPPLDLRPDPVRDPIRVDASLDEGRIARMALRLPGRLALRLDGPRTQLHLGPGRVPEGQGEGLHVSGHADTLALPAWMALGRRIEAAVAAGDGGGLAGPVGSAGLQGVDLTTDALRIGAFAIPDVALRLARNGDGQRLWVDGASRGELQIGGGPRTHLTGRFERLRLRRAREDAADEAPFDDGERDADTLMREALDPAQLPSADLLVTDLLLDDLRLGQLDMRLEPTEGGLRLSRLRLSDGALDLEASGLWRRPEAVSDAATRMQLEAELRTDRIDALLSALGFARTLVAEDFRASARLRWSEMEWLVQLAGAEGELSVEATDGRLAAVEPGAGRMLGLFNFFALPRRLGLDFRDVTDGGLAFDRLGGSFRLGGGNAFTEDLSLEGPSLRVEVRGRVGLAARDYDQRIRIYPDLSGGMTIGGAVLGGPIGVGIALLARELFETPIEAATRIDYRLVGDWSDPRIIPENIATTGDRERPR